MHKPHGCAVSVSHAPLIAAIAASTSATVPAASIAAAVVRRRASRPAAALRQRTTMFSQICASVSASGAVMPTSADSIGYARRRGTVWPGDQSQQSGGRDVGAEHVQTRLGCVPEVDALSGGVDRTGGDDLAAARLELDPLVRGQAVARGGAVGLDHVDVQAPAACDHRREARRVQARVLADPNTKRPSSS